MRLENVSAELGEAQTERIAYESVMHLCQFDIYTGNGVYFKLGHIKAGGEA